MPGESAHVAIGIEQLERIAAQGWRGLDEGRLGTWLLRAAGGFTGRANSALILGPPPAAGDGWVRDLEGWYHQRGLEPMAQIPLPSGAAVEAALAAAGWRSHDRVRVLTADIHEVHSLAVRQSVPNEEVRPEVKRWTLPDGDGDGDDSGDDDSGDDSGDGGGGQSESVRVCNEPLPDNDWLLAYKYRGDVLPSHAREVLEAAEPDTELSFASVRAAPSAREPGEVLAVARGALAQGWLGVTAVTVTEQHRRRRWGTRLMAELAGWGLRHGGRAIYLQVAADNTAALGLYSRMGFHHHHDYRYRIGPAAGSDLFPKRRLAE